MFVIALRFSQHRGLAAQFMDQHRSWIRKGVEEDVFLLVGSLQLNSGGAIIAHNTTLSALQDRVALDPFVVHDVVVADIMEITPSVIDERLAFLQPEAA